MKFCRRPSGFRAECPQSRGQSASRRPKPEGQPPEMPAPKLSFTVDTYLAVSDRESVEQAGRQWQSSAMLPDVNNLPAV